MTGSKQPSALPNNHTYITSFPSFLYFFKTNTFSSILLPSSSHIFLVISCLCYIVNPTLIIRHRLKLMLLGYILSEAHWWAVDNKEILTFKMYKYFDQIILPLGIYHTDILSRTPICIHKCVHCSIFVIEKTKYKIIASLLSSIPNWKYSVHQSSRKRRALYTPRLHSRSY